MAELSALEIKNSGIWPEPGTFWAQGQSHELVKKILPSKTGFSSAQALPVLIYVQLNTIWQRGKTGLASGPAQAVGIFGHL